MRPELPSLEQAKTDTPLRLEIAARPAFPDGSMTASGLRREATRGRLAIEKIARKDFTTLAEIERMRELCRVQRRAPDRGSALAEEGVATALAFPDGNMTASGMKLGAARG